MTFRPNNPIIQESAERIHDGFRPYLEQHLEKIRNDEVARYY